MSYRVVLILLIVVIASAVSYRRGGPPERLAAMLIAGWVLIDAVYHLLFGPSGFDSVDPWHLFLDGSMLVAIVWLALRANRVWPLFAAAAQLMCFSSHFAVMIAPDGARRAYWAMTQLPQYIQLTALLAGAAAHTRRRKLLGPYRSWRAA